MVKRQWNNQKGFALPLVLLIFSISFILATSVFVFTYSQMKQEVDFGKDIEALHFAEAGLHYAREYLNNSDPDKVPGDIQGIVSYNDDNDDVLLIEGVIYQVDDTGSITGDIAGRYVLKLSTYGTGYTVSSTGWPATDGENNKRTVEAIISKKGFTDYLYFFNRNYQVPDGAYINGPYHSNRDLSVEGSATFAGAVTYVNGEFEIDETLHVFQDGPPRKINSIDFPSSSQTLENLESVAVTVYSGDTRIFFWDSSMFVSQEEPLGEDNGDEDNEDGSGWVTEFVPLVNGVIYVDGDVYVSGEVGESIKGVTIAASGSIFISPVNPIENDDPVSEKDPVDWIRCKDPVSILGLIAGNQVRTMTEWYNGDPIPMNPDGIKIKAAVFAFGAGFHNEGVLTFEGSITQNQNELLSEGFTDTYQHSSLIPPHFIEPQNTRYEIISWIETNEHISFP